MRGYWRILFNLLLHTDLTLEQRDFTETIRRSSEDLLTIINDILDFSKIEVDRLELEQQSFDLRDCIEDAPRLLVSMRQAIADGNAAGMRLAAHNLKSNSADFGALTLADLCRQLESLGRNGTLEGAAALLSQAELVFAQVRAALQAMRAG